MGFDRFPEEAVRRAVREGVVGGWSPEARAAALAIARAAVRPAAPAPNGGRPVVLMFDTTRRAAGSVTRGDSAAR